MTPHQPDLELARRARAGEEAAWREIYEASRDRLFALLVFHCGDRSEALDLLQESYLAAWRGLGAYRGEGRLESWLVGIALRRARDWRRRFLPWRRARAGPGELDNRPAPAGRDPALGVRLQRALGHLPERQRSAFLLHEWLGYSFEEIAGLLRIGASTARVHAFRARLALRAELQESTGPAPAGRLRESES